VEEEEEDNINGDVEIEMNGNSDINDSNETNDTNDTNDINDIDDTQFTVDMDYD